MNEVRKKSLKISMAGFTSFFPQSLRNCIGVTLIWGQFHHHFTSSFYVRRSQKCIKDSQVKQIVVLLGSACIKAAHKHVDEIDPDLACIFRQFFGTLPTEIRMVWHCKTRLEINFELTHFEMELLTNWNDHLDL